MRRFEDSKYIICRNGDIINSKTNKKLKHQDNGKGYKKVTITINGKQIQRYVHRLVAYHYCKGYSKGQQVNHIDGVKSNNKHYNLEWVNNSENQKHAHRIGLKKNGNELWNGLFTKEDIKKIKCLSSEGVKGIDIALLMKCSKSTISEILSGKRYKYV